MSRAMNRARRLREMERLYLERAYTDREMADALGVRRETAYQDRLALETEDEIPFIEHGERGRRRINRAQYLPNLRVNLHKAHASAAGARGVRCSPYTLEHRLTKHYFWRFDSRPAL